MRPRVQVVIEVRAQDAVEMPLIENDDMVEAFSTDRTHEPFAIRILPRRPWRTHDLFDVQVLDARTKRAAVDSIAITNQESRHLIEWERFNDLLRRPLPQPWDER